MRYRKKPVEVDTIVWNGSNVDEIKEFCNGNERFETDNKGTNGDVSHFLYIHTLEGKMYASVGDYIIKGVNGEFYPCKPDIFEKTYDEIP